MFGFGVFVGSEAEGEEEGGYGEDVGGSEVGEGVGRAGGVGEVEVGGGGEVGEGRGGGQGSGVEGDEACVEGKGGGFGFEGGWGSDCEGCEGAVWGWGWSGCGGCEDVFVVFFGMEFAFGFGGEF